jgi:integrase
MQAFRDRLDRQVLPALGGVRVRKISVGLMDRHLAAVRAMHGPALAKMTKSVISGMCALACRHDALRSNPCRDVARIPSKPRRAPQSLTVGEVKAVRTWLSEDAKARDRDLPDLVAFMVATRLRIGEACAVTWSDVDVDAGTVTASGDGASRQESGPCRQSAEVRGGGAGARTPELVCRRAGGGARRRVGLSFLHHGVGSFETRATPGAPSARRSSRWGCRA